jgi:hypothetical protein
MQRTILACAMAGLMISGTALGQGSSIPSELQGNYARFKANILKAADKMPAENYSFKPTPDIRTFARVVNHVTEAQLNICGKAEALKASFAECDKAYAGLTDANMTDMIQAGPLGKRSRLSLLWGNVSHDNEQYATLSLYLRLKGLVPPTSEK